jgi:hypothetical protein
MNLVEDVVKTVNIRKHTEEECRKRKMRRREGIRNGRGKKN